MNQSSSTENWITVKEINNNMIVLDNKKLVSGIKIVPKNIFIMDEISQNRVIDELRKFYNQIDFEFWEIVADRPTNIDLYISQLELQLNNVLITKVPLSSLAPLRFPTERAFSR